MDKLVFVVDADIIGNLNVAMGCLEKGDVNGAYEAVVIAQDASDHLAESLTQFRNYRLLNRLEAENLIGRHNRLRELLFSLHQDMSAEFIKDVRDAFSAMVQPIREQEVLE